MERERFNINLLYESFEARCRIEFDLFIYLESFEAKFCIDISLSTYLWFRKYLLTNNDGYECSLCITASLTANKDILEFT